jgi:hypothetical protein
MMDKAERAREMIKEEADHLEKAHREQWPSHQIKEFDMDHKRGVIEGLRKAAKLLGE